MATAAHNPQLTMDIDAAKSNISEHEYAFKHRLLFAAQNRYETRRLRSKGESVRGISRTRLHVFKPIDERSNNTWKRSDRRSFTYNVNIPERPDSITQVENVEIRFLLIPTQCRDHRDVTIKVAEEETKIHVDACRPRWESLTIPFIQNKQPQTITMECIDCSDKETSFSSPYLNIVSSSTRKNRLRRGAKGRKSPKTRCQRHPLKITFKNMPGYKWVSSPTHADIGYCGGKCTPPYTPHNAHVMLQYAMFKSKLAPRPCCAPYDYKDLQYLRKNGTSLAMSVWKEAIAISCSCQ